MRRSQTISRPVRPYESVHEPEFHLRLGHDVVAPDRFVGSLRLDEMRGDPGAAKVHQHGQEQHSE